VLETRSLDFKNVIIVGANEGFLPASGQGDSFLPNDVRYELKLPLQYERDAVYAYHFWRLIQRAEEISIIYNTESDPLFGKEPSRYISQIEHELLPAFPKIDFKRMTLGIDYEIYFENTVDIYNRELIDKQLNYIASKGLSFSRLYNFIKCPRLFLLEGIYNIEKWENENGNIAINTLGSVFHAAIEHVTLPYIGKLLVPEDFDKMISQIESGLEKGLEKYKVKHTNSGFNYLAKELLFDILKNWLINMKNSAPANYYVKATEYGIDSEIMIEGGRKIKIKGIADRVEYHNGTLRIMDFKTTHKRYDLKFDTSPKSDIKSPKSEIKSPESDIKSPESDIVGLLKNTKNRYLAQVLFYSWLYSLKENVSDISGGVYSVLSKAGHKPDLIHEKNSPVILSKEQLDKIGSGFIYFIEEIFSPEQTFRPTPSNDNCQYCSYKSILCDAQQLENMDDE
jgi:CRISPR/Cas system-associated exonuclease Cas4 (RecB family)